MQRLELLPTASTRRIVGYPIIALALIFAFAAGKLGVVIAIALVAGYVALNLKMRKARLIVDETGVEHRGAFSSKKIRWDEVKRYRFMSIDPTANMHASGQGGLIAVVAIAAINDLVRDAVAVERVRTGARRGEGERDVGVEEQRDAPLHRAAVRLQAVHAEVAVAQCAAVLGLQGPACGEQCSAQVDAQVAALATGRPVIPDRLREPGRPLSLQQFPHGVEH